MAGSVAVAHPTRHLSFRANGGLGFRVSDLEYILLIQHDSQKEDMI